MDTVRVSTITACYRGERFLEGFLACAAQQTLMGQYEVVLVHNDPSEKELEIVSRFWARYPRLIRHVCVKDAEMLFPPISGGRWARETLAQSLNRAILNGEGDYVAIWNVDDLRPPESLRVQADILNSHANVDLVYSDFIAVTKFGETRGKHVPSPEYTREEFQRSCIGGFQMFRKDIVIKSGLFDEQLRSGADFDLWVRIAANGKMLRCKSAPGYFLTAGPGSSASNNPVQPIERTVIELRYGIYDKIDERYVEAARKNYRIDELFFGGKWHHVSKFIPDYEKFMADREPLKRVGALLNRKARHQRRWSAVKSAARATLKWPLERAGVYDRVAPLWRWYQKGGGA